MKKDDDKKKGKVQKGITRRGFLTTVGVGAVGVAASSTLFAKKAKAEEVREAKQLNNVSSWNLAGRYSMSFEKSSE